jgi:hypothetical protein
MGKNSPNPVTLPRNPGVHHLCQPFIPLSVEKNGFKQNSCSTNLIYTLFRIKIATIVTKRDAKISKKIITLSTR